MDKKPNFNDIPLHIRMRLTKKQVTLIKNGLQLNRPFLITGTQGATGKTTLKQALRELGATAYEPYEMTEISLNKIIPENERI